MAMIVSFELPITDRALKIAQEYHLDFQSIALRAIQNEVKDAAEAHNITQNLNPIQRNEVLRTELLRAQEQIARLTADEGRTDWLKFL